LTVSAGGFALVGEAIGEEVESGIVRAEIVSIPLTIIIQIVVFGSIIAAGLPLIVGILAIVGSMAGIFLLSQETFQSVFAVNIITMLGLGLGIDYSLFMVTRFREELEKRSVADAVAVTMGTVGKAIFASGVTVIMGLAATQFFPLPALRSMGQAGMVVTAVAVVYGLTFLPALLAILGHRVNSLSIGRKRKIDPAGAEGGFWAGLAQVVMRNATLVVVALVVLLLAAGIPMLRLDLTPGGPDVLPSEQEPRIVSERLVTDFPQASGESIPMLVTASDGNPLSPASLAALQTLVTEVQGVALVERVDGFVTADVDWATFNGDISTLPAPVAGSVESTIRGDQVLLTLTASGTTHDQEETVQALRDLNVPGVQQAVGGGAAASVDTIDGISSGIVPAAIFVTVGAYLILLLTFGSVFLPLKAMFMTLLSISASLGAVVWIFQFGNLQGLFGFQASGEIISTTPILMFCILFGLSMDYEVLMLSRIQEEYLRTGDNQQAVATGLAQTAKVITGAALIMVVVFGGFMLADIVVIKSLGFGLALAVLIDATIVRGLLVPATMRLMGRWNWWAPQPVRRIVDRFGLSHTPASSALPAGD
jgi:RND superfamily putative drug exporter